MSDHIAELVVGLRKRAAFQRTKAKRALESYYPSGAADAFDVAADLLAQALDRNAKAQELGR